MLKKNRGKKEITFEEPIIVEPIIEQPIIKEQFIDEPNEDQLPETFEVDDNILSKLNNIDYQKDE